MTLNNFGQGFQFEFSPSRQRLLLAILILVVFWDGIFAGIPRADQVGYLHYASRFDGALDLLLHSPSWNRGIGAAGDEILFRPVLYMLMAGCLLLFGYNFVLWQLASLTLHVFVVLGLHALLWRGALRVTLLPFLLALFFALSLLGSELVLWNHIIGYVLFCLIVIQALNLVLGYLENGRARGIRLAALLGLLAEFTYELGVVVNLMIGISLLIECYLRRRQSLVQADPGGGGPCGYRYGALFIAIAFVFPLLSILDLAVHGITVPPGEAFSLAGLPLSLGYAIKQIGFWLGAALFPTAFALAPVSRVVVESVSFGTAAGQVINYLALVLLAAGSVVSIADWRRRVGVRMPYAAMATALPALVFLLAYSLVIANGRGIPRGIQYVLFGNIHYSYMAYLAMLVAIALFAWSLGRAGNAGSSGTVDKGPRRWPRWLLQSGLAGLLALNALGTMSIAARLRYEFSLPLEILHFRARLWLERYGKAPDTYFVTAKCPSRGALYWQREPGSHVYTKVPPSDARLRAEPVTFIDLLYPRFSYAMQKPLLAGRAVSIRDICDAEATGR